MQAALGGGEKRRHRALSVQLGNFLRCVDEGAPGFKLVRHDGARLAAANDRSFHFFGHSVGVTRHPAVRVRPPECILSPIGHGRLPMVWVLHRGNFLVFVVQLAPEKVSEDLTIDILAGTNVLKVQGHRHVAQHGQRRIAHLMDVILTN